MDYCTHLNSGAWSLDCVTTFTPLQELDLKRKGDAVAIGADDIVELSTVEDFEQRKKAVKKREESDYKKVQKVKEAVEKAALKEKEKIEKVAVKAAEKAAEKGNGKKKLLQPETISKEQVSASPTVDVGSQLESVTGKGIKRDSFFEVLSQVPVVADHTRINDCSIDEFIVNTSLDLILGGGSAPLPQTYKDLKSFLKKVCTFSSTF